MKLHVKSLAAISVLSLAVSYPSAVWGTQVTGATIPSIEDDSLESMRNKSFTILLKDKIEEGMDDEMAVTFQETHSLRPAVDATHEDLNQLKQSVLSNQTFLFKNNRTQHKRDILTPRLQQSLSPILNESEFNRFMMGLTDSLFEKELQYLVANIRNERSGDLSGLDFVNNRQGNPSLSIGQLDIAIPIYDNERDNLSNNALTPAGKNVNTVTANLVRRLLNESPQNLKRGLRLKIDNPNQSAESLWNTILGIVIPRQVGNSYIITPLGELIAGYANQHVDWNSGKLPPYRDAVRQIGYIIGNTLYDTLNQTLQ